MPPQTTNSPVDPQAMAVRKPTHVQYDFTAIPAYFRARPQWVIWRYMMKNGTRWTKVPVQITGEPASSIDPATWTTFEVARVVAEMSDSPFDGIGYCIAPDEDIVGVDVDHAVDAHGTLNDAARTLSRNLSSYTELSVSGTGIHIFAFGTKPGPRCKNTEAGVEMYARDRFLTFTGQRIEGTPPTIEHRQSVIEAMYALYFPAGAAEGSTKTTPRSPTMSDEEVLARCRQAKNRDKFERLYDQGVGDGGPSEHDFALIGMLRFYTQDAGQIERLMRGSKLVREKWDEHRPGGTYLTYSIDNALEGEFEVYAGTRAVKHDGELDIITLSSVESRDVDWLWPGRIPFGMLTLLGGVPGVGKTFITHDIAARVTQGLSWHDSAERAPNGDVIFLAAEDTLAQTVRPRLDALGADCSRVHVIRATKTADGTRMFSLADDLPKLQQAILQTDARFVVVDPLNSYLGGKTDNYSDPEVRRILTPLAQLAEELNVAVVSIMHLKKGAEDTVIYRIGGSVAFAAVMRSILFVSEDQDEEAESGRLFLTNPKMSVGPKAPTLAASITPQLTVQWEPKPIKLTAEQAMAPRRGGSGALGTAVEWLRERLQAGPQLARNIEDAAAQAGISGGTLKRARVALKVEAEPVRDPDSSYKMIAAWSWVLPKPEGQDPPTPSS